MDTPIRGIAGSCAALGFLVFANSGCLQSAAERVDSTLSQISGSYTNEKRTALRQDIEQFLNFAEAELAAFAERIEAESPTTSVQQAVLRWNIATTQLSNDFDDADREPAESLMELWTYCVCLQKYLESGDGSKLFQGQQAKAIATAGQLNKRIETIAEEYVPAEKLAEVQRKIQVAARANPIQPIFVYQTTEESREKARRDLLGGNIGRELAAIGKAGRDALDPTSRLADEVHEFTAMMEDYPALVRWQTNLLWLQLQDSASVKSTTQSIEEVGQSSARLAAVAEELPQRVREELQLAFNDLNAEQDELRTTVREVHAAVASFNEALVHADSVSTTVERSLGEVTEAGTVWRATAESVTETVKQIQKFTPERKAGDLGSANAPPAGVDDDDKKFDINDYTRTAEALTATTTELQALFAEIRGFLDDDNFERDLDRVNTLTAAALGQTVIETRDLVDHLAWRLIQICGLIFVLAIAYRFFAGRVAPRRAA